MRVENVNDNVLWALNIRLVYVCYNSEPWSNISKQARTSVHHGIDALLMNGDPTKSVYQGPPGPRGGSAPGTIRKH